MRLEIRPATISGTIEVASSKSITQRALICAALAKDRSILLRPLYCSDTLYTINALRLFGVRFNELNTDQLEVIPPRKWLHVDQPIDCGDSGTTLRFMIPFATILQNSCTFKGTTRLLERIQDDDLIAMGYQFQKTPTMLTIFNQFTCSDITLSTKYTTQLISGLMLSAPLLEKGIRIRLKQNEFEAYIALTIDVITAFGGHYITTSSFEASYLDFIFSTTDEYQGQEYLIEGDYSNAANIMVLAALSNSLIIKNLKQDSLQGDTQIVTILREMGCDIATGKNSLQINKSHLHGTTIDLNGIPDLGPLLISLASICDGDSYFTNYERLIYKETNRLATVLAIFEQLGLIYRFQNDTLIIPGNQRLVGGVTIDVQNDHRLIMMLIALSPAFEQPIQLLDGSGITKSDPLFFTNLRKIGAIIIGD